MINQPDIQSVFHPTFLGNRVLAKPINKRVSQSSSVKNSSTPTVSQTTTQTSTDTPNPDNASDAIVINVHLSGQKILQQFGWVLAACLWGLVFAFFLMR